MIEESTNWEEYVFRQSGTIWTKKKIKETPFELLTLITDPSVICEIVPVYRKETG